VSRRKTNARLRDPITVRSTSSGLSTYYYYSFGFFWIIFYSFPIIKLSPFYLITSPVPTCLVHNCETSQRLFYSHLLSPLSQDQIPFDPHHRFATNPGRAHWETMKHIMAYVKGTTEYEITYHRRSSLQPVGFTDSDFANDKDI